MITRNGYILDWWDTASFRNIKSEEYDGFMQLGRISADGKFLLIGCGTESLLLVDLKTGKVARKHSFSPKGTSVYNLAFHPQKATQAVLWLPNRNKFVLWDVENWQEVKSHAAPTGRGSFVVSPDGRYCYTSAADNGIYQADLESAKGDICPFAKWHTKEPVFGISPGGRFLGSCATDGRVILWELPSGNKIQEWNFQELPGCPVPFRANGCIFSPDSRHLATTHSNGTIYFFRLPEALKAAHK